MCYEQWDWLPALLVMVLDSGKIIKRSDTQTRWV
jgi:hypothetical protein